MAATQAPIVPNVRIVRKIRETPSSPVYRVELLGSWFVKPENTRLMSIIREQLAGAREMEPEAEWTLQARGEERGWHDWPDGPVQ